MATELELRDQMLTELVEELDRLQQGIRTSPPKAAAVAAAVALVRSPRLSGTSLVLAPSSLTPAHEVRTRWRVNTNCTAPSRIPTVNGNTVRGFCYARTTARSPRKLNQRLTLLHPINSIF
jgi:hypothetical protein